MADFDIYDDLDELHAQEQQKAAEELQWKEKYEVALIKIEKLQAEKKELSKKIKQLEANFTSLLQTARTEIKRKDNQIAELRKEKDDICFRRDSRPAKKQFPDVSSDEGRRNKYEQDRRSSNVQPRDASKAPGEKITPPSKRQWDEKKETEITQSRECDRSGAMSKSERIKDRHCNEQGGTKSSDRNRDEADKFKNKTNPRDSHSCETFQRQDKCKASKTESQQNSGDKLIADNVNAKETSNGERIQSLEREILEDVKQLKQKKQIAKSDLQVVERKAKAMEAKSNELLDALFDDIIVNDNGCSGETAELDAECAVNADIPDNRKAAQSTEKCSVSIKQTEKKAQDTSSTTDMHLRTPLKHVLNNHLNPPPIAKSAILEVPESIDMVVVPEAREKYKETKNGSKQTLNALEEQINDNKIKETKDALETVKHVKTFKFVELDSSFYSSEDENEKAKESATDTRESASDIESPPFENFNTSSESILQSADNRSELKSNTSEFTEEPSSNSQDDKRTLMKTIAPNAASNKKRERSPANEFQDNKEAVQTSPESDREKHTKKDSHRHHHKSSTRSKSHKSSKCNSNIDKLGNSSPESSEIGSKRRKLSGTEKKASVKDGKESFAEGQTEKSVANDLSQDKITGSTHDVLRPSSSPDNLTDLKMHNNQINLLPCDKITDEQEMPTHQKAENGHTTIDKSVELKTIPKSETCNQENPTSPSLCQNISSKVESETKIERTESKNKSRTCSDKAIAFGKESGHTESVPLADAMKCSQNKTQPVDSTEMVNESGETSVQEEEHRPGSVQKDVSIDHKEDCSLKTKVKESTIDVANVSPQSSKVQSIKKQTVSNKSTRTTTNVDPRKYMQKIEEVLTSVSNAVNASKALLICSDPQSTNATVTKLTAKVIDPLESRTVPQSTLASLDTRRNSSATDKASTTLAEKATSSSETLEISQSEIIVLSPGIASKPLETCETLKQAECGISRGRRKKSKNPRKCNDDEQVVLEVDQITSTVASEHTDKPVDNRDNTVTTTASSKTVVISPEPDMSPLFVDEDSVDLPLILPSDEVTCEKKLKSLKAKVANFAVDSSKASVADTKRRSKDKVSTPSANTHVDATVAATTSSRKIHHKKRILQSSTSSSESLTKDKDSTKNTRNSDSKNAKKVANSSISRDEKATILSASSVLDIGMSYVQSPSLANDHKRKYKKKMMQTYIESGTTQASKDGVANNSRSSECKAKEKDKINPDVGTNDKNKSKKASQTSPTSVGPVAAAEEVVSTSSSIKNNKRTKSKEFTEASSSSKQENLKSENDTNTSVSCTTSNNKKRSYKKNLSANKNVIDAQDSAKDSKKRFKKLASQLSPDADCSTTSITVDINDQQKKATDQLTLSTEALQQCDEVRVESTVETKTQSEPDSENIQVESNTIYLKRKTKSNERAKKRKLSSEEGSTPKNTNTPSKRCKVLQATSPNNPNTPLKPAIMGPNKQLHQKHKRSLSPSPAKPGESTSPDIFHNEVCPGKEANLPPVYNATEDDVQYREIDNKMRSMFQSPTYSYTNLDFSFSGNASKENVAVLDSPNQSEKSQCDTSSSSRKISVGSNEYVIETIGAHTANVFITRKKFKKRAKVAVAAN